jgi:hypothetical protein
MTLGRILLLLAAIAAVLVQARAAPLDAESCAKLMNEHGQLEQAGVEADMAKGPEWGKANLLPEKLDRIRRFIEIEEQLLFRCRQKSLVNLPPEVEAAPGDEGKDKSKDQDKNAAAPPTTDKTKAPPAAAKKGTGPAKKAAVQPAAKQPPKQPKQVPGATKPPAKAKAAAKQPAGAKTEPAPSPAAEKGAPKAKTEQD